MESNVLQKRWVQGRNVVVDDLRGTAFTGENGAHTFRVIGVDSAQETVAITGTITGRFLTATNVTVPLTGSVSDGVASLTLTEDCYVIPGRFVLSIYATNGSTTQCIYCAVGNVFRTQSDIIEYPSASIPDIEQIIADAQAAVTQINADVAAAQAAVAAAQTAVDGIEDQRQTMIASIASVAGQGTDTTLTQSGVAADAKAAGDQVSALKSAITEQTRNLVTGVIAGSSIDGSGKIIANASYDMWYAPIVSGKSYTVMTDDASGLVYGIYTSVPALGSTSTGGRTISANKTFTASASAYIAFRTSAGCQYAQIEAGTQSTEYIQPISAIDAITRESLLLTGNAIDPNGIVDGKYVDGPQGNVPSEGTLSGLSYCKFPVKGQNGTLSLDFVNYRSISGNNVGFIGGPTLSDTSLAKISKTNIVNGKISWTGSWTNNDDMYAYINMSTAAKSTIAIYVNKDETEFVDYGVMIPKITNRNSPIYAKKLCVIGDSIMYGAGSTGGFAKIIADDYNMLLQNIAVSGGTIASGTLDGGNNRFWIAAGMSSFDDDGDFYLVDGGINDYNLNVAPFPSGQTAPRNYIDTTYPADLTTFSEAMEAVCYNLVVNHTGKKCGFVFTHKIGYFDWTSNQQSKNYMFYKDVQKSILKKWGVPFIDLSEIAGMDTIFPAIGDAYTANGDRAHPNEAGYKTFYVPHIVKWMENL